MAFNRVGEKRMWIDTHTHLYHKRFDNDRTEIVAQMAQSNIQQFIEVSLYLNSNTIMRER